MADVLMGRLHDRAALAEEDGDSALVVSCALAIDAIVDAHYPASGRCSQRPILS
jgi:hypothetical protein